MPQAIAGSLLIHMVVLALAAGLGRPITNQGKSPQRVLNLGSVTIYARDLNGRFHQ